MDSPQFGQDLTAHDTGASCSHGACQGDELNHAYTPGYIGKHRKAGEDWNIGKGTSDNGGWETDEDYYKS